MKVSTASIILASLLACSSAKRDHFDTIREVIGQREQVSKSIECEMDSDADSCAISDMDTSGTSTLVNPGGETRCIYSNTGPFKFQVWPGGKMPRPNHRNRQLSCSEFTRPETTCRFPPLSRILSTSIPRYRRRRKAQHCPLQPSTSAQFIVVPSRHH